MSIRHYLSLIKFSHTVFALPFAMIGFTLGVYHASYGFFGNWFNREWPLLIKVLLCMVFARSGAMAFNRYLDREFDALNPRTANREIPAGVIAPENALAFTLVNVSLFILTTGLINQLCFYLSFVALAIVLTYSYMKRVTPLCHLVLGLGLALAPVGAYLAVTNTLHPLPVLFSLIVLTWVAGFDIIYALQDEEFDKRYGLHSIPAALGKKKALLISTLLHVLTAALVLLTGWWTSLSWMYWAGAIIFCVLLAYQHVIVKPNDLSKVNQAFGNTNGIASVVYAAFTIWAILNVGY